MFVDVSDEEPYDEELRVSWWDGVYQFVLRRSPGVVVTADRWEDNAPAVLDSFLIQLTRGQQEPP